MRRADLRTIGLLSLATALLALQWSGVARHPMLLVASGVLAFVACIAKHNHMHCATFTGSRSNSLFQVWLALLTGTSSTGILTPHNVRHHGKNQSGNDFVRCSVVGFRSQLANLLAFPFAAIWTTWREKPNDLAHWRRDRPKLFRQALLERGALAAFAVALFAVDWRATLLYVVLPCAFGQWALVAVNYVQHAGCDPESEVDHSRNVTGALNWLFLNNGYHGAHHVQPGLHWSELPSLHAKLSPRMRDSLNHASLARAVIATLEQR